MPADRERLLELAARCEAAEGPTKALDREIALAVGWVRQTPSEGRRKHPAWFHPDDCRDGKVVLDSLRGTDVWRDPPAYTASLDAALTLVPEGCWAAYDPHFMDEEREVKFRGYTFWPDWTRWTPHGDWIDRSEGNPLCATPALALCAAALRALAHGDDQ